MKLIVTGGAGFIGSAVVRLAVARGHDVVNVDALTYAACLDNVASVAEAPNYTFTEADIRDRATMDRVFAETAPDVILHLAAESHVDRSIDGLIARLRKKIEENPKAPKFIKTIRNRGYMFTAKVTRN